MLLLFFFIIIIIINLFIIIVIIIIKKLLHLKYISYNLKEMSNLINKGNIRINTF